MGMNPGPYHLFEMGVVHAALSCFSGPSTRICSFVLFEFGDGMIILPGSRDVPTQIPGHPGHSLSETTEKGHLHKVFIRDIPTSP